MYCGQLTQQTSKSSLKNLGNTLFEPGPAGREVRTLPLCYAYPQDMFTLRFKFSRCKGGSIAQWLVWGQREGSLFYPYVRVWRQVQQVMHLKLKEGKKIRYEKKMKPTTS